MYKYYGTLGRLDPVTAELPHLTYTIHSEKNELTVLRRNEHEPPTERVQLACTKYRRGPRALYVADANADCSLEESTGWLRYQQV